mgnify:CR=1 FL=1
MGRAKIVASAKKVQDNNGQELYEIYHFLGLEEEAIAEGHKFWKQNKKNKKKQKKKL